MVDVILCLGQVTRPAFLEIEVMIGAMDLCLDVGDEGLDPARPPRITGSAKANDDRTALRHGRVEASQSIGDQMNAESNAVVAQFARIGPLTPSMLSRRACWGYPSSSSSTAAMNRALFSEPRAKCGVISQHDTVQYTSGFALSHGFRVAYA